MHFSIFIFKMKNNNGVYLIRFLYSELIFVSASVIMKIKSVNVYETHRIVLSYNNLHISIY